LNTQTHTHMWAHRHTHTSEHTDTHTRTLNTQTHTHMWAHRHTHTSEHTDTHTHVSTQTHTHMWAHRHTHTCEHTDTHTCEHTDTHIQVSTQTHTSTQCDMNLHFGLFDERQLAFKPIRTLKQNKVTSFFYEMFTDVCRTFYFYTNMSSWFPNRYKYSVPKDPLVVVQSSLVCL
jgi:hypothetical protein